RPGGAHRDLCLQLAVELVEAGSTAQQRQRAHAGEIAAQRVGGIGAGHVDVEFAAGLAAIGAEIGDSAFEHAAVQRRVNRNRCEVPFADVEFGGGKLDLGIDIVQA